METVSPVFHYIARTLRERGVTVLLMSPTLTDPTCGWSFFDLEGTVPFLARSVPALYETSQKKRGRFISRCKRNWKRFNRAFPRASRCDPTGCMFPR